MKSGNDNRWIWTLRQRPPKGADVEFVLHNLVIGSGHVVTDNSINAGDRIVRIGDVRQWRFVEANFNQMEKDEFECPVCHGSGLECTWCYDTGKIKASDWKEYVPKQEVSDDGQ